jgi:hypothetical protein
MSPRKELLCRRPFPFRVTDHGTNVATSVWLESDPSVVFTTQGHLIFARRAARTSWHSHNRETVQIANYNTVLLLDDISVVPEPATLVLALFGLATVVATAARGIRAALCRPLKSR